jgi:lipopolysaccharide/colanic/teichoic acid biosynthesis glycosyltransferase
MQQIDLNNNAMGIRVAAYADAVVNDQLLQHLSSQFQIYNAESIDQLNEYLQNQSLLTLPEILLIEIDKEGKCFKLVEAIQGNAMLKGLIIVLLSRTSNRESLERVRHLKIHDYYVAPFPIGDISERLIFLVKFKLIKPTLTELSQKIDTTYKIAPAKRIFDIVFSGMLLLVLSPLLLIVALIVRLSSKGPIIYKSKRVGTGYKIFDFYKFRSMRPDADKKLAEMAQLNQYAGEAGEGQKTAFVKFKNDPRVTKFGHFIRKTSIDELPQLVNIFKGDMSTVGNRPLPLYEAEMLTTQEWSWRFLAPAGLTGLWQISKRGRAEMSERERKKLDNFYAQNYSIWLDMKILVKTVPALFQKEAV